MGMRASRRRRVGAVLDQLAIREIRDDCLILRAAQATRTQQEYQAVIQVDPVNFALMAESEQLSIFERYRAYLAGRTPADGPLCVHARTSRYDISPYLDQLEQVAQTHPVAGYRQMARSHKHFVEQLAATRALLSREFWARVSVVINTRSRPYRYLTPEEVFEQARAELERTVQATIGGLDQVGLVARRLRSLDLVNYYLSCATSHDLSLFRLSPALLEMLDFPLQGAWSHGQAPVETRALLVPAPPPDLEAALSDHAAESDGHSATAQVHHWVRLFSRQIARKHRRSEPLVQQAGPYADTASFPDLVSLPELLQPASLEETPHYVRVHFQRDEYVRARAIIGYPASVYPGWLDQLLRIDEPDIDMLLFLTPLDPTRYVKSLGRRLTSYRATQMVELRHGRTENPYIEAAREEVEQLRERLVAKTEQVQAVSLYVLSRADTRQALRERDQKVAQVLKGMEAQSVPVQFEQLPAYLSGVDGRDTLRRSRVLPTSVVACLFPFCSHTLSTEPGALVGITPDEGLIFLNPTSPQVENGHVLTLGQSGAGKSLTEKQALMRHLVRGLRAVVLDPEDEYHPIGERFAGTRVELSPANLRINPFDLPTGTGERAVLKEKLEALLTLFDLLLADTGVGAGMLKQSEKGYLSVLCTRLYTERGITADSGMCSRPAPCMLDLYELIRADGDPYRLGERMARYADVFPARTEVDLENQLVIFTLKSLKETSEELLRASLYLIAEHVWRVTRSMRTPDPRLLFIDEAWTLLEFPEGGKFLEMLVRRGRKYNLHVHLVSQHVTDLLATKAGEAMLNNVGTKILLRHEETALDTLSRVFKLSENERRYMGVASKGQGLLFCRSSHTAFYAIPSSEEYQLANTNLNERLLEEQAQQEMREEETARAKLEARAVEERQDALNILFPYVYAPAHPELREEAGGGVDHA